MNRPTKIRKPDISTKTDTYVPIEKYYFSSKEPPVQNKFDELSSILANAQRCVTHGITDEALLHLGMLIAEANKLYDEVSSGGL